MFGKGVSKKFQGVCWRREHSNERKEASAESKQCDQDNLLLESAEYTNKDYGDQGRMSKLRMAPWEQKGQQNIQRLGETASCVCTRE